MVASVKPASTIVLLRDAAAGVEVLVVRRHGKSGFMAGATVFPGGKVDEVDGAVDGHEGPGPGFYVSALRELHEEAGVLIATDARGRSIAAKETGFALAEVDEIRNGHHVDARGHHDILQRRSWRFDQEKCVPFAHWVTPEVEPKRFDTWFFAAQAPSGQAGRLDGHETTDLQWILPQTALHKHEEVGELWLPPPTYHTLHRLARIPGTAADVLATLRASGPVPCWIPLFVSKSPQGPLIVLPGDSLHPDPSATTGGRHRFTLRDGRFRYTPLTL